MLANAEAVGAKIHAGAAVGAVIAGANSNFIGIARFWIANPEIGENGMPTDVFHGEGAVLPELFAEADLPAFEREVVRLVVEWDFLFFFLFGFGFDGFLVGVGRCRAGSSLFSCHFLDFIDELGKNKNIVLPERKRECFLNCVTQRRYARNVLIINALRS
jgi:hypothetical protein